MTRITLRGVSKQYSGRSDGAAVDAIDLDIASGEFFTLLGPSGCGKTTTLRMVAGFVAPTSGAVLFDDDDVTRRPAHRRGTGMVFQNYALFPHLSVAENVGYGLKVRRIGRADAATRIDDALRQVRLDGYGRRRIDALSGGQQQRVALARALVIRPRVLLLDEPLSNLDAKLREETRREIRDLQTRSSITALYVTHDQGEAMAMSDRIAVMESGRVHQVGSPQEIYRAPATAFVARFIGNSNVLEALVEGGAGATRSVLLTGSEESTQRVEVDVPDGVEADGGVLSVAVRPEHVTLVPRDSPDALAAVVTSVEFTGLATNVELDLGGARLGSTLVDGTPPPATGETVGVRFSARPRAVRP